MQPNSSASTRPRERTARKQSAAHKPPSQHTEHLSHPSRSPQKRYFREWRANPLQRVAFFSQPEPRVPARALGRSHTRSARVMGTSGLSLAAQRSVVSSLHTYSAGCESPSGPPQTHTSSSRLAMGNAQPRRVPQPTRRVPQPPKDGSRGWGALQSPGEQQHQPSAKRRRGRCSQGPSLLLPDKVKHR